MALFRLEESVYSKYSIRELLLIVLIAALATVLGVSALRNRSLSSQLIEIQKLNIQLDLATKRYASCELELDHFARLVDANVETIDDLLNAHRRESASNLRIAEIQFKIDHLLYDAANGGLIQRKKEILDADIAESRRIIADLESRPKSSAKQVAQAKQQLVYFKTQAEEIAK